MNEIVFKKFKKFAKEDEYRFVHIEQANFELLASFNNGKINLCDLGLELENVYTNNTDRIRQILPHLSNKLIKINL